MQNAFGHKIPQIREIVTDPSVKATLSCMLIDVLTYLGLPHTKSEALIRSCLGVAADYRTLEAYEETAHRFLEAEKVAQRIPEKLKIRAELMYSQIAPYLAAGSVLDYGCGDGQVSEIIAKNKYQTVSLTDVYLHRHVPETGLAFKPFKQGEKAPFKDGEFNNVLALTVFHHSSNPVESIVDVARVTHAGGRVLVVESVFGVDGKQLSPAMQKKVAGYAELSGEQQRKVNVFFDHFYNRILHYSADAATKVNVPFNFNTPDGWQQVFAQNGLVQEEVVHLGLDQPTAPEYHTLHVLRKQP
jgi:SAM-dependent methyltransferase